MATIWKLVVNWAISFDQSVNALTGGDPDETISSRLGKVIRDGECVLCKRFAGVVCTFLDFFDPGHCIKSIDATRGEDDILRSKHAKD